jgi:predicted TPR repeat methyltransferase
MKKIIPFYVLLFLSWVSLPSCEFKAKVELGGEDVAGDVAAGDAKMQAGDLQGALQEFEKEVKANPEDYQT